MNADIFIDFGLFEILVAIGIVALVRRIYSKKPLGISFPIVSVVAPATMLIIVSSSIQRLIAGACSTTTLVNVAAIGAVAQAGKVRELRFKFQPRGSGVTKQNSTKTA